MRLKVGDLVRCKKVAYTLMWCPEMVGKVGVVTKVDYGPTPNGENDLFWVHMAEPPTSWTQWKDQSWTPTLWEKCDT